MREDIKMSKEEVKASEGFDEVLANDTEMLRLKPLLDEAKVALTAINIQAINRMRELMFIDSDGKVGKGIDDKAQELEEIAKLAIALYEAYKEEAVVEIVETLVPDWKETMVEDMVDKMFSNFDDLLGDVEADTHH